MVRFVVALTPFRVAVIVVVPVPAAFATPKVLITATPILDELHET
jgi:hypothetical protein